MPTTVLFVEYLVMGVGGWGFLVVLVRALGFEWGGVASAISNLGIAEFGLVVVLTYVLGIGLDGLVAGLERLLLTVKRKEGGRVLRKWYRELLNAPRTGWLSAQHWMWSSAEAYNEFLYHRLRIRIARVWLLASLISLFVGAGWGIGSTAASPPNEPEMATIENAGESLRLRLEYAEQMESYRNRRRGLVATSAISVIVGVVMSVTFVMASREYNGLIDVASDVESGPASELADTGDGDVS